MDHNLDNIAQELYDKIRTRFNNVKIGDENAGVLSKKEDIPKARFFEFQYAEEGQPLGTVSITLDSDDGLVVQSSSDLTDRSTATQHNIYKFFKSLGQFAKDRLIKFKVNSIGKSNLDKRDYDFHAKRKEQPMDPIMENKMYGTSKISYQDLGEAKLIVKHNQPVNTDLPAGRTMHINSIYIENAVGERFKYPFKHLNGARALAEHIKHGGNPYDAIGKHITGLSEELGSLRKFKNYVARQDQISEAMGDVTSRVFERINSIKKEITSLQRSAYYESFAESFTAPEEKVIPEHVMNDWVDRLTIRTFNEELKSVFPYLYNIVDESSLPVIELSADDILSDSYNPNSVGAEHRRMLDKHQHDRLKAAAEKDDASEADKKRYQAYKDKKEAMRADFDARMERESIDPETQFESIIDSIVSEDEDTENGLFSPNKDVQNASIEKLNDILSNELKGGPGGTNAIQSLKGLIDEPDFVDELKNTAPDLDVRALVQQYVLDTQPDLLARLNFPGSDKDQPEAQADTAPAPEAAATPPAPDATAAAPTAPPAPAPAPAPAAPVAEGKDEDLPFDPDPKPQGKTTPGKFGQGYSQARHLARQGMLNAIKKARKAGATLDSEIELGNKKMTISDCIQECGLSVEECGFEPAESGTEKMLKFVSGFYNRDDGNFPLGGQRIKIKVKKAFEDGEFGDVSVQEVQQVLNLIDKKDPSGNEHNQIMRLAGVKQVDHDIDEAGNVDLSGPMGDLENMMKGMKVSFGDNQIDMSNPQAAGEKLKGMMAQTMQGVQQQMPNQNMQVPGGQLNPAEMMKQILQKIQSGN